MSARQIVESINAVLGRGQAVQGGHSPEVQWNCPFCPMRGKTPDRKRHLYLNTVKGKWKCHRCDIGGTLEYLCTQLGIRLEPDLASWAEVMQAFLSDSVTDADSETAPEPVGYPPTIPIDENSDAAYYLAARGFTRWHVEHYGLRIGLGKLGGRIIIPTFVGGAGPTQWDVAYWVARAYYPGHWGPKYLNPPSSSARFWVFNLSRLAGASQVRVCEGVFSAIAAGWTGVATFGKHLSRQQERALVDAKCGRYVMSYDGDAPIAAINAAERLREDGCEVWIAQFQDGKDPADLTQVERDAVYAAALPYTIDTKLRIRAELLLNTS